MGSEFDRVRQHPDCLEFPSDVRCPDWRSSGAKRLMPQLQIKVPTLRRWGAKLAVAVDAPFFASLGARVRSPARILGTATLSGSCPS